MAWVGNFWHTLYREYGGFPSFFEFSVGPAVVGVQVYGSRLPGLPPLPLGWLLPDGL